MGDGLKNTGVGGLNGEIYSVLLSRPMGYNDLQILATNNRKQKDDDQPA